MLRISQMPSSPFFGVSIIGNHDLVVQDITKGHAHPVKREGHGRDDDRLLPVPRPEAGCKIEVGVGRGLGFSLGCFLLGRCFSHADKDTRMTYVRQTGFGGSHVYPYISMANTTQMNLPKAIVWLLAVFFGLSSPVNAQLNLKTGYSISFLQDASVDHIIQAYSQGKTYSKNFKDLTWLHGFEAGLRWKTGVHALELTYLGGYQRLRATATNPSGGEDLTDKLKFNVHSAGIAYQISRDFIGAGFEMQRQWYITGAEVKQPDLNFKHTQAMWAKQVYLMFNFEGSGSVSMTIKPYYIFPSEAYDCLPLRDFLETNGSDLELNKWNRFGVTLLFYNGQQ